MVSSPARHEEQAPAEQAPAAAGYTGDTEAIETVLRAEREAERSVGEAGARAERTLADARTKARRIGERADERIKKVHARCAEGADAAIRELERAHRDRELAERSGLGEGDALDAAVARVVAWLLGDTAKGER